MKTPLFLLVLALSAFSSSVSLAACSEDASAQLFTDASLTEREDPNCKLITSDSDGRTRVLCMIDGNIWDTWGQCKTYCH